MSVPSSPTEWVSPNELDRYWVPSKEPVMRPVGYRSQMVCVTVGFRIEADGTTSAQGVLTVDPEDGSWSVTNEVNQIVRQDSGAAFVRPAIVAVKGSRFKPAGGQAKGTPVYTYRSFSTMDSAGKDDRANYLDPFRDWCEARMAADPSGQQIYFREPGTLQTTQNMPGSGVNSGG